MSLWFRAYCEALDNVKIQTLEPELFKAWFNLCALAKIYNNRIPNIQTVAFRLRVDAARARHYLDTLSSPDVRLLEAQADGSWVPHDWEDWQYPSDSSTERVQKHRANKKQEAKHPGDSIPKQHETLPERSSNGTEQTREEQSREEQSREEKTTTTAAPVPSYTEFPLAAAAVREEFPATDDELIMSLAAKCSQSALSVNGTAKCVLSDSLVADAVREARSKTSGQRSPVLYLKTVPQVVKTWMIQGRKAEASTTKQWVDPFKDIRPKPWTCTVCGRNNPGVVDNCRAQGCIGTRTPEQEERNDEDARPN